MKAMATSIAGMGTRFSLLIAAYSAINLGLGVYRQKFDSINTIVSSTFTGTIIGIMYKRILYSTAAGCMFGAILSIPESFMQYISGDTLLPDPDPEPIKYDMLDSILADLEIQIELHNKKFPKDSRDEILKELKINVRETDSKKSYTNQITQEYLEETEEKYLKKKLMTKD